MFAFSHRYSVKPSVSAVSLRFHGHAQTLLPKCFVLDCRKQPCEKKKKRPTMQHCAVRAIHFRQHTYSMKRQSFFFFFLLIQFHNPNFIFSLAPSFPDLPHGEIFICIYTPIHLIKMWLSMIYFVISLVLKQSHQQKSVLSCHCNISLSLTAVVECRIHNPPGQA